MKIRECADWHPEDALHDGLKERDHKRRIDLKRLTGSLKANGPMRNDILPNLVLDNIQLVALQIPARSLRKADAGHIREVAHSICALGFCEPVLVGKDNLLLNGAIRVEAGKLLGLASVPCIRIGHLSNTEQRMLTIAVNRLQEKGGWDLEALKIEFEELLILDQPIEITGFSLEEVDGIILSGEAKATETGPLEPERDAIATVRLGDVFQLGPHRIVCGDARDPAALSKLMADTPQARLVFTDEPYNVPIAGHVSSSKHRDFAMAAGEMSRSEFLEFNLAWMESALVYLCDGGLLASFIDWRGLATLQTAANQLSFDLLNLIVWAKTNAGMGSLYRSQHELLPLFKKGKSSYVNNVGLGRKGRWRSNVWTYPGASSIGSDARRGLKEHPTVKPTAMLEDALLDLTRRGEVVLDPFLGSGSTLAACQTTGRVCRGVELDPLYVEVAMRRFEALTGKQADRKESNAA